MQVLSLFSDIPHGLHGRKIFCQSDGGFDEKAAQDISPALCEHTFQNLVDR